MLNPHPPLSGVPSTLLCLIVGAELLSYFWQRDACRSFARTLLYILCIATPITYYSGYFGSDYASQSFSVPEDAIGEHQAYAQFFLISLVPCLVLQLAARDAEDSLKKYLRGLYLALLFLSFAIGLLVSFKGGELVFRHAAGVRLQNPETSETK